MSSAAPPLAKKIRLEQKAMPVSSEEELSLITLREQNQKLSNNYNHRIRIEADLKQKIEQLEETLRLCEDKEPEHQLSIVNDQLRERVEDLEFELNKARLNERRLTDDLDRINKEFVELRKAKSLQANHTDSISVVNFNTSTTTTTTNTNNDQHNHQPNNSISNSYSGGAILAANQLDDSCSSDSKTKQSLITHDDNIVLNQAKAIQDLEYKLKDQVELAKNRLNELESLNEQHKDALMTIDKLKIEAKSIPKEIIIETNEYKTLQSHFSVLYNEATQLKTQLVESRAHIIEMKNAHVRQIDRMEHDELRLQRELRTNIVDLEQSLAETRGECNMLRLELDNMSKQYEATIKLDTELKKTLSNYRIQVSQRTNELNRLKRLLEESKRAERHHIEGSSGSGSSSSSKSSNHQVNNGENLNNSLSISSNHSTSNAPSNKSSINSSSTSNNNSSTASTNNITSGTATGATATPAATNNSNNNANNNIHPKKILDMEKIIHQLQKQLDKMKSEEEALMNDLDVTGQAYEDSQEQNHRLLEQLEEKDNANFKLMSEHLKTNAYHKTLNDAKATLEEQRDTLLKRISAQENVIRGLEEKVHLLQENMSTLEKELETRNSMNDGYKRELLDSEQKLAELNSEKQKILVQLDLIQKSFSERSTLLTHESFKNKRLIEELESLKKKYERASKLQSATTPDEVLMEEIREYKEQLTCPSCKTKPKDAVLTKCFHVFCFDCLKTRVDTRQRKCPKCNAQFGANDFHRLYLA